LLHIVLSLFTTKKNRAWVTRAGVIRTVTRVVAEAIMAVIRAGKDVDEKRDVIIDYGIQLLKEQSK